MSHHLRVYPGIRLPALSHQCTASSDHSPCVAMFLAEGLGYGQSLAAQRLRRSACAIMPGLLNCTGAFRGQSLSGAALFTIQTSVHCLWPLCLSGLLGLLMFLQSHEWPSLSASQRRVRFFKKLLVFKGRQNSSFCRRRVGLGGCCQQGATSAAPVQDVIRGHGCNVS